MITRATSGAAGVQDFESFYRSHHTDAVRWATALIGNRAIGEELAQDALLRVGQRLYRLDNPGGYLRTTVANVCASWHRTNQRDLRRVERLGITDAPVSAVANEMLDALARLPYRQRAAVVMRYWADWPEADIAAALDCRPTTVRTLIHRGLAALRQEIEL